MVVQSLLMVSAMLVSLAACLTTLLCTGSWNFGIVQTILCGVFTGGLYLLAALLLDMVRLKPAKSHTLRTLLSQYLMIRVLTVLTRWHYWRTERNSQDCSKVQRRVLMDILQFNSDTEHGKAHNFRRIDSRERFVQTVPLTRYGDYTGYIQRLEEGEQNLMSRSKILYFAMTSGTTGKPKRFPLTEKHVSSYTTLLYSYLKHRNRAMDLKRVFEFYLPMRTRQSACGIPMGPLSQFYFVPRSSSLYIPRQMQLFTSTEALHVQAVFILQDRDVGYIEGIFTESVLSFFTYMDENHREICQDIAKGSLGLSLELPDDVRADINATLRPNPERARQVECEFAKGPRGLAKRLWPHLCSIKGTSTGSSCHTAARLEKAYTAGVPFHNDVHGSSEAVVGAILDGDLSSIQYTMFPDADFFEFIPVERSFDEQPETLFMEELEKEKLYEIVVTTYDGLCRYRLGDVIKVVDFFHSTPKYEFQYRLGQLLNLVREQTPENVVYEALKETQRECKQFDVMGFTATETTYLDITRGITTEIGHYVIFVELPEGSLLDDGFTNHCAHRMDSCLSELRPTYRQFRQGGTIAPLIIVQVMPGTFADVKRHMMGDSQNQQFKMPMVSRRQDVLQLLLGNRVKSD